MAALRSAMARTHQSMADGALVDHSYVGRLRTLVSLGDFELDSSAILKPCNAIWVNSAVVNEDVRASIERLDKPKPLGAIEPLYGPLHKQNLSCVAQPTGP